MWKIALFIFLCIFLIPSKTDAGYPDVGIGLHSVAVQFSRTGVISATSITWGNAVDITWGDGTIITEN